MAVRQSALAPRDTSALLLAAGIALAGLVATVVALIASGSMAVAAMPLLLAVVGGVLCVTPVRVTLLTLVFLCLALDATGEGPWSSPLAPIGGFLVFNVDASLPTKFLPLPGLQVLMLVMAALLVQRRLFGSSLDTQGTGPTASPFVTAIVVSFVTVLICGGIGLARGGDLQMAKAQVQPFVFLLLMAFLSLKALRGVRDYRTLGKIVVVAALIRAAYVLWVTHILVAPDSEPLPVAGTHGDSLLFAAAAVLLVVRMFEDFSPRTGLWLAGFTPLLVAGMLANNRRLVWVEVAAALVVFAVVSRRSRLKRYLTYAALVSLPIFATYVGVGWSSASQIFAPVRTFRSVFDSEVDASTMYRELENFNLLQTMRLHPITGLGLGLPFDEIVVLPDISFFKEYRYMPHNSILGLWAFTGPVGFTGIFMVVVVGVYLAGRSYRAARSPDERTAAFMTIGVVVIYAVHCWGDIGFSERRSILLVGPALGIAGQLCCATGGWRTAPRKRATV